MDIDTLEGLMKCPLLKGLSQQEVINLMHQVRYRIVRYEKGSTFATAGDTCLHADIVLSGERQKQASDRLLLPSRQELANMLAVQKFSVQRTLNELDKEGIIKLDGKYVEISNPSLLKV